MISVISPKLHVKLLFLKHDMRRELEKIQLAIARRLPVWLRYWVTIVNAGESAVGKDKSPADMTAIEILKGIK